MHLAMFSSDQDESQRGSRIGLGRAVLVLLLLALLIAIGTRTLFFVDETEYVYVTQFGQPLRLHTEAGLGIKWPYQSVRRFDRRLQIFGPPPREILTEDKENLEFDRGRIATFNNQIAYEFRFKAIAFCPLVIDRTGNFQGFGRTNEKDAVHADRPGSDTMLSDPEVIRKKEREFVG